MRSRCKPNPTIALGAALALSAMAALAAPATAADSESAASIRQDISASAPSTARQGQFRLIDADALMDAGVTSNDGRKIGKLKFLMIDPGSARVVLALVGKSVDYDHFVALPWGEINLAGWRGNGGEIALKADKGAVDGALTYTVADVGRLTNPIEQAKVFNLYAPVPGGRQGEARERSGAQADNGPGPNAPNKPYVFLGHEFVATMADPALTLDNQLKGSEIYSGGQNPQKIGEIKKLMIDPDRGKVAFAVVAAGQYLGMGEQDIAVPLQALAWTASGRYVLSRDRLDKMKSERADNGNNGQGRSPFTDIPSQRLDKLYQAFGVKPYWQG